MRICRTLGTPKLRNLDPFLMLDELRMPASQGTAGFPSHPHRGFETCSIMLSGRMEHRDSFGNHVSAPPPRMPFLCARRGVVSINSVRPEAVRCMLHGQDACMHAQGPSEILFLLFHMHDYHPLWGSTST